MKYILNTTMVTTEDITTWKDTMFLNRKIIIKM